MPRAARTRKKRKSEDIKLFFMRLLSFLTPGATAALGVLVVGIIVLFIPPYIGIADNGDFFRVFSSNGLYVNQSGYDASQFGYFVKQFGIYQYFNEQGAAFISSQSLFIQLAIFFNKLFFSTEVFDVRFLAAVQFSLYIPTVYLLVEGLTAKLSGARRYVVAVFAVLIFGDTAYLAYFNSFFGEGIMLIAMMLIAASFLLFYTRRYPDYFLLGLFTVASLLLVTVKQQNSPMALILSVLGILFVFLTREKKFRISVVISLVLILVTGVLMYAFIPKTFVTINQYQTMSRGILLESKEPEQALKDMGMNEQYALLKGTTYYQKYKMIDPDDPFLEKEFYEEYGFVPVLQFYLTHPDEFLSLLNLSAKHSFQIRPNEMGNYEKSVGKPFGEKTQFFTLYSNFKPNLAPSSIGMIVLLAVALLIGYGRGLLIRFRLQDYRGLLRFDLVLVLIGTGFAVLLITLVGDGEADLEKHEFLFNVCYDIALLMVLTSLVDYLAKKWQKRRRTKNGK
ncbi:DUF2232 domain-containing protein [Listeria floridensis]